MDSIYRNESGKYSTAVYRCDVRTARFDLFTEEWVESLFPKAFGKSVTAWGHTVNSGDREVRWFVLIASETQTTAADVRSRIERHWPLLTEPTFDVTPIAALANRGSAAPRTASSRRGTKRRTPTTSSRKGVAAL